MLADGSDLFVTLVVWKLLELHGAGTLIEGRGRVKLTT